MTKLNVKEIRELSVLPQMIEADKVEAQTNVLASKTKAKFQVAMLEGIVPDEETSEKRKEIARMRADNELLEEKIKRAELLKRAEKAGLIKTPKKP